MIERIMRTRSLEILSERHTDSLFNCTTYFKIMFQNDRQKILLLYLKDALKNTSITENELKKSVSVIISFNAIVIRKETHDFKYLFVKLDHRKVLSFFFSST